MTYGIMNNKRITIAQLQSEEYEIPKIQNQTGTRLMLVPSKDATLHLLITSGSNDVDADAEDLLIPANGMEIDVSRILGRISVYNSGSSEAFLYVSVLS